MNDKCERCGAGFFAGDCGCQSAHDKFTKAMDREIRENNGKGGRHGPNGRGGWISARTEYLLAELHDHTAKLHIAAREADRRSFGNEPRDLPWGDRHPKDLVLEFAADTANLAMMLCDSMGAFTFVDPTDGGAE